MKKSLIGLVALLVISCSSNKKEESIKANITDITETVYASAKVKPMVSYYAQSMQSGVIKNILIKEGDQVKKGQAIIQITIPVEVENRLSSAIMNLNEAKANFSGDNNLLLNIEADIRSTLKQLNLDSTQFMRLLRLWNQNIGTKNEVDRAQLAYDKTRNQLDILQQRRAQTQLNLENNYLKALVQSRTEKSKLADFTILSEIDGVVYALNKNPGDLINPNERLAEIGATQNFIIYLDIDEVDIAKIKLKDSVIITLDAYADSIFIARVERINPKKDDATQTFEVECHFEPPIPQLYNGLSGEANIIVARRANAVVIPSEYLLENNNVRTIDGIFPVKVGLKNLQFVEIIEGIDTSMTLLKRETN